jgi:hypothetical protein
MTNPYTSPIVNEEHSVNMGSAITQPMLEALRGTKGWVMLIGVMLFIAAALTLLGAIAVVSMPALAGAGKNPMPFAAMLGIGGAYGLFAVIYIFLGLYLVRYAGAISRLLKDGVGESMEQALQQQQKFWRLAGVMVMVGFGFAILGMLGAIIIPMLSAR